MAGQYRPRRNQHSHYLKQHELSNAYSALAAELTKTEIRSIGGYSLGRIIGEGTFGKVRLGVHRLTGTRVAIKQVPKSLPSYSPSDPSSPLSLLTREIHHHRRLRHPHVLSLFELVATESSIYLVTELCAGGELFDYLVEQTRLSLAETRRIFGQLVLGVAYLHGEGVVHRDLKLENVLLDENVNVKIADMGFGREFEKGRFMETRVGTLGYMAPEVVAGQRYLGEEVDIWSLGVILYALLTGSLPFDDDDEGIMRQLILDCKYEIPEWLEEDAASLIRSILIRDPLQRLSLKDILSHPFFTRPVASGSAAPSAPTSPSVANYPSSIHSPGLGLSDAQTPDFAVRRSGSGFFGPAPSAASPPSAHSLSEVQRGKQRASDPPPSHIAPPPPTLPLSARSARPSALPPHLATSPTPRIRRHPSTASIDFGPSAPAPSGQLFPPAMQRTSSAGAASINSLRIGMGAAAGSGSGPGSGAAVVAGAAGQKRRRSIGSLKSVRMQDVTEGEEVATSPPPPPPRDADVEGSRVASPRLAAASSAGSVDDEGEESADFEGDEPPIDYVSLLMTTSSAPALLSTPDEQALLQQLTLLGFDAGQVAHSVRTSACDSCSAIWWMLRRKRDLAAAERELEGCVAAGYETAGDAGGEGKLSRTNSLRSVRRTADRVRDPAAVLYDSPDDAVSPPSRISMPLQRDDYLEILTEEQGPLSPLPTAHTPLSPVGYLEIPTAAGRARERTASTPEPLDREPSPPQTPPKRPSLAPATPAATLTSPMTVVAPATPTAKSPSHADNAEARLSFFLNSSDMPATASSVGMLSYFPTVEGAPGSSPTSKRTMGLPQSISRDSLAVGAAATPPDEETAAEGARRERARSGSASLLARATSAIGHSLATLAQGGSPDEANGGESTPRQVPVKLPTTPKRATTAAPGVLHRTYEQPEQNPFLRPPAVHASASAPPPAPSHSPPVSTSPLPRAPHLGVTSLPASPGRSASRAPSTSQSALPSGTQKSASDLARSASSAASKKNKGGNLLTTFKHWFGQDPHKRKRASMSPRLGGPNGDFSSSNTSVARSQSMYAATTAARAAPLAIAGRPQMSSRKSSYNSAYTGAPASAGSATMSRRSSVSSAHRAAYLAENGTPLRAVRSRRRRLSDASRTSRTSLSERGDHSRPSSVRSLGGPGGSTTRRHRHSTGATNSPSGSYVTAKEVYRRPPTTTTVRRRHGSRGRHSSELTGSAARHHRRTASSTSSMHRSSSGSNIAAAGSDGEGYVDEDDVGEDPIMEEDEDEGDRATTVEASESARDFARSRTLRALHGEDGSPAASSVGKTLSAGPTLPRTSGSSPAMSSTSASLRSSNTSQHHHHAASTFMAHKSTHLFGSPLQPHAPPTSALTASQPSSLSRRATVPAHVPRRNVFAAKEANGEWIDEDDELAGYGGGLGQGNTTSLSTTDRPLDSAPLPAPVSGPQHSPGLPGYADSPVASKIWGSVVTPSASGFTPLSISSSSSSSTARFENRYAGVAGAAATSPGLGADATVFANTSGVGSAGSQAPPRWTQAAPVIEEDEEE